MLNRLSDLNICSKDDFVAALANVFEYTPWIAEQAEGSDRDELTIARRFFANATDAERDLIAYWQMVKLVEAAHLRYARGGDA